MEMGIHITIDFLSTKGWTSRRNNTGTHEASYYLFAEFVSLIENNIQHSKISSDDNF